MVLYGLVDKKTEIEKEIKLLQEQIMKFQKDIASINDTICIFDPSIGKELNVKIYQNPERVKNSYFKANEARKVVMNIFSDTNEQMTTKEVVLKAMTIQRLDKNDKFIVENVGKTLNKVLRDIEYSGYIKCLSKPNAKPLIWVSA